MTIIYQRKEKEEGGMKSQRDKEQIKTNSKKGNQSKTINILK
jgi:hypothetical protein